MKITDSHIFFEAKFGRNDFKEVPNLRLMGEALAYLMKYLEKLGEKVVYSRGYRVHDRAGRQVHA